MEKCLKDLSSSEPGFFNDPYLIAYADVIRSHMRRINRQRKKVKKEGKGRLKSFADYHKTFGLHPQKGGWVLREWAPNAERLFILCNKNEWKKDETSELEKKPGGVFEIHLPRDFFSHQDLFRLRVVWPGGEGDRIPTAATRVVQDPGSLDFNAQVWHPQKKYRWRNRAFKAPKGPLLVYEAHVGMALEEGKVGTYREFEQHILPKIKDAGYNTLQLMAIQEHPYYGSFGYHVSSFFAPSSRFGTPEALKSLVDKAHGMGLRVLMDIVHSHGVRNEVEGLSRFDGTITQFFHDGPRGEHRLWDSRCFDYSKTGVLRFLLSNLRYWLEEFNIDGFRFDGITSMLFEGHGLGRAFTCYDDYYGPDVDVDALAYLRLANELVHGIKRPAVTIAEDVSGYPGLAAMVSKGGIGFNCRFAMGIADFWIKLLKDNRDEDWPMGHLWHELTTRRPEENTISYAESHDQALVGDKTLMMHLMGGRIYTEMTRSNSGIEVVRGVALHKMIRLITLSTANSGYLNFMGNEFGHPEWVDFPSAQNGFSYHHARRQWSLKYNPDLYYACLYEFDRQMIRLAKERDLFASAHARLLHIHEDDKVIAFERNRMVFVFNFNPVKSFENYMFHTAPGTYRMVMDTDEERFGGQARLTSDQVHFTLHDPGEGSRISLYLPSRCAMVLTPEAT